MYKVNKLWFTFALYAGAWYRCWRHKGDCWTQFNWSASSSGASWVSHSFQKSSVSAPKSFCEAGDGNQRKTEGREDVLEEAHVQDASTSSGQDLENKVTSAFSHLFYFHFFRLEMYELDMSSICARKPKIPSISINYPVGIFLKIEYPQEFRLLNSSGYIL